MKERLEELKKQKNHLGDEYNSVAKEIERIEKQMQDENTEAYVGKWYCKEGSNWNEFDTEYTEYEFIYITKVSLSWGTPYFYGIRLKTDTNYRLLDFSFERFEDMALKELHEYQKALDYDLELLGESLAKLLKELFNGRTELKEELKQLLEQ